MAFPGRFVGICILHTYRAFVAFAFLGFGILVAVRLGCVSLLARWWLHWAAFGGVRTRIYIALHIWYLGITTREEDSMALRRSITVHTHKNNIGLHHLAQLLGDCLSDRVLDQDQYFPPKCLHRTQYAPRATLPAASVKSPHCDMLFLAWSSARLAR